MSNELEPVAPEPKRDRWGRYLVVPSAGGKAVPMTRATTISEILESRHAIELWKMRNVAVGLAGRPDLLAQVASTSPDDKSTLNSACQSALDAADADAAANMGTALHRIVERVNLDPSAPVPEMFSERVEAYLAALAEAGLTVCTDAVERIHVIEELGISGMADFHATWAGDGRRYVCDLKTGSGVAYGAGGYAVQLAIYSRATSLYRVEDDTHEPVPELAQDRGVIIHLPAKGGPAKVHWIDLAAGAEALPHAVFAHRWRSRKDLLSDLELPELVPSDEVVEAAFPGAVVDVPATEAMLELRREQIVAALPDDREHVMAVWRRELQGVRGPKAASEWTAEQMDAVERAFELGFTDPPVPVVVPERPEAPVVPLRRRPDLGGPVDAGSLQVLRERARRQSAGVKAWVRVWQDQAIEDESSWKMGRGKSVTLWAYEVSRAALYLARILERRAASAESVGLVPEVAQDEVRLMLSAHVGDLAMQESVTIGALLGSLSLEEATALADAACDEDARLIEAAS